MSIILRYVLNPFQSASASPALDKTLPAQTGSDASAIKRGRRRVVLGIGLSLLFHAIWLLIAMLRPAEKIITPTPPPAQESLTVQLVKPTQPVAVAMPPKPQPAPTIVARKKPRIIAPHKAPPAPLPPLPTPPVVTQPLPKTEPLPTDMSAMLNAARERRRIDAEQHAQNGENTPASEPGANDIALANIQHSLHTQNGHRPGDGGIFYDIKTGVRMGQFKFRGWNPNSHQRQQTIEVDGVTEGSGDVQLAIVRGMIKLIRAQFTGDFPWESNRLGRVVMRSSRPEDNAALEAFLMKEVFSNN